MAVIIRDGLKNVLKIEYSKISIQPDKSKTACQIFVWDLFNSEEQNRTSACKIFSLVEVDCLNRKTNNLIDQIFDEIKPISSQNFLGKTPENFFENLVQRINYKYVEIIGEKKDEDSTNWPPKINALLVLCVEKNIYFVQSGNIYPFLIHQTKPHNSYKIVNISENASGKDSRSSNINLFSNIISGKININDYLLFTTESLLDYFSLEKLSSIISQSSSREAAKNLKELLAGPANPNTSFCSLIIKFKEENGDDSESDIPRKENVIRSPDNSMEKLLGTVADTEKFLTPSMHMHLGSSFFNFFEKIKNSLEKKQASSSRKNFLESGYHKYSLKIFKKVFGVMAIIFKWTIKTTVSFVKFLIIVIFNRNGERRARLKAIPENLKVKFDHTKKKFLELPRSSQIFLVAAIVLFCIFIATTITAYSRYKKETTIKLLNEKIEAIQEQKNLAEASVIYNDQITAVNSLKEAEKLLAEFPQNNEKLNETYSNLRHDIQLLGEKIRNIKRVVNLNLAVDFKEENQKIKLEKFLLSQNNVVAFGKESSLIYSFSLKDKKVLKKQTGSLLPDLACLEEEKILFYGNDKKFFEFDPIKNSLKQIEVALGDGEDVISSMTIYNQRLYTISPSSNQIFKHSPTIVGFAKGSPWIKEGVNLDDVKDIAIDGSIYVLKNSGLVKFNNGNKNDFAITVEPIISLPTKIWTTSNSSYIYILESSSKRIIVIDKQGKLKIQYFLEGLNNIKDFAVAEKEKKIYLLDGTQILSFDITHL